MKNWCLTTYVSEDVWQDYWIWARTEVKNNQRQAMILIRKSQGFWGSRFLCRSWRIYIIMIMSVRTKIRFLTDPTILNFTCTNLKKYRNLLQSNKMLFRARLCKFAAQFFSFDWQFHLETCKFNSIWQDQSESWQVPPAKNMSLNKLLPI